MRNPFLNALPVIANALGDSLGVEVVMNAGSPRTNGKVIYLPSLDGEKPESRTLGLGFTTHESGHVRFTDFGVTPGSPLEKMLCNLLEDIRIEKLLSRMYPGCKLYLAEMVEALVNSGFFAPLPDEATPTQVMQQYMLHQLRLNVLEQEGAAVLAEQAETQLTAKVPAGMRVRLEALMYQVEDCDNTQDVLNLARSIITMMEEEAKKEEEKKNQQKQGDSTPNQQGQDPQNQGGGTDDGKQQQGNPQSGTGDASQSEGEQNDTDGQDASAIIEQILSAGEDEAIKDTGEALKEALGQAEVSATTSTSAAPFNNVLFDHRVLHNKVDIDSERNRVCGASNALRVRAQALLQAQTMATKRSVLSGTKLNVKNLHQARLGGAVFQKTKDGVAVDTAISILVDRSGSMASRIGLATDAALATTMAFDRHDVKTAVFTFPFERDGKECNAVLKHWDGQPAASVPAYKTIGVDGSTPMAEAMMGACIALMQRPERRKILLVATDGAPDNKGQAQWVINLARKSGVEVLGLGILCEVAGVFGSQWSGQIGDINNLPEAMIGMLDNVMLKKAA